MRRSPARRATRAHALALLLLGASLGCTLSPGAPWGELEEAALEVTFAPSLDDEGRMTTALGYALALESMRLSVGSLSLHVAPLESPSGGHDHDHDHGHGGDAHASEGEPDEALLFAGGALELSAGGVPVELLFEGCEGPCPLPRGELVELGLTLSSLELTARAFDAKSVSSARLPDEGAALFVRVDALPELSAPLALVIDGSEPTHVSLRARLTLPPSLLDGVDFARLPRDAEGGLHLDEAAASSLRAALSESELEVEHDDDHNHEHDEGGGP